jgi:hypothetical protein
VSFVDPPRSAERRAEIDTCAAVTTRIHPWRMLVNRDPLESGRRLADYRRAAAAQRAQTRRRRERCCFRARASREAGTARAAAHPQFTRRRNRRDLSLTSPADTAPMADGPFRGHPVRRIPARRRVNSYPTTNDIAERAHQIFLSEGRRLDKLSECWRRAENELLDIAARRTIRRT